MAEVRPNPEQPKKDALEDRTSKLVDRVLKQDPDEKTSTIREKMDALVDEKKTLLKELAASTDPKEQAKLNDAIIKADQTYQTLQERGEKLLSKASTQLEAHTQLADQETALKTQLTAKDTELRTLTVGTPEYGQNRKEAADLQGKLDRLGATEKSNEKAKERLEKSREHAAKAAAVQADEVLLADRKIDADLKLLDGKSDKLPTAPEVPETPKEDPKKEAEKSNDKTKPAETSAAPEAGSEMSRTDHFIRGVAMEIAGNPPKTGWEKFVTSSKSMMIHIALMVGEGDHSWGKDFNKNEAQRTVLEKVIGMKLTPDPSKDHPDAYKIDWTEPDPEYKAPDKVTQDLFAQRFAENGGMDAYDRVTKIGDGNPKLSEVLANASTDPSPEGVALTKLATDLQDKGVKDTDLFLDAVSKKGYLLLNAKAPEAGSETAPPQPDLSQITDIIKRDHFTMDSSAFEFKAAVLIDMSKQLGISLTPQTIKDSAGQDEFAQDLLALPPSSAIPLLGITLALGKVPFPQEILTGLTTPGNSWTVVESSKIKEVLKTSFGEINKNPNEKLSVFLLTGDADEEEAKLRQQIRGALEANASPAPVAAPVPTATPEAAPAPTPPSQPSS